MSGRRAGGHGRRRRRGRRRISGLGNGLRQVSSFDLLLVNVLLVAVVVAPLGAHVDALEQQDLPVGAGALAIVDQRSRGWLGLDLDRGRRPRSGRISGRAGRRGRWSGCRRSLGLGKDLRPVFGLDILLTNVLLLVTIIVVHGDSAVVTVHSGDDTWKEAVATLEAGKHSRANSEFRGHG